MAEHPPYERAAIAILGIAWLSSSPAGEGNFTLTLALSLQGRGDLLPISTTEAITFVIKS
jgi:hypothetical protein